MVGQSQTPVARGELTHRNSTAILVEKLKLMAYKSSSYLRHDVTDVVNALCDGLAAARDRDGPLGGVGQHLTRHLHARPAPLPDLPDL